MSLPGRPEPVEGWALRVSLFQSFILGVVQGLGEFLPISSSGHLIIVPWAFGFPDPGLAFDVALHFGTLFALIAYFWRDWIGILKRENRRLLVLLVLSALPGAVAGVFLDDWAETIFRHPLLVAFDMSLMGAILLWADNRPLGSEVPGTEVPGTSPSRRRRREGEAPSGFAGGGGDASPQNREIDRIGYRKAFLIGCAQSLALVPGVSRSGATITAGLACGLSRQTAARFSFLMATPITFGACLFKSRDFFEAGVSTPDIVGIVTSGVVGFLAIWFLLRYVQQRNFRIFVYYRFLFSLLVVVLYFL